jgi:hypothetical protein
MKETINFSILIILLSFLLLGCKRGRSCDDKPLNEYYDIPISTIPFILNKKDEILVFANTKGDTIEFLCTEESHDYELIYSDPQYGSIDCHKQYKKYAEYYKYKYKGDPAFFRFMDVKYIVNKYGIPLIYTDFGVNISDSINSINLFEDLLIRKSTDSIYFSGQYYLGTYFVERNIVFNSQLGIIKFIDNNNVVWQLINKK